MTSPAKTSAETYSDKVVNNLSTSSLDLTLKVDPKLYPTTAQITQTSRLELGGDTLADGIASSNSKYERLVLGEVDVRLEANKINSISEQIRNYAKNMKARYVSSAHREKIRFLDEVFWNPDNKDGDTEEKIRKAKLIIQNDGTEKVEFLEFIVNSLQAQDSESVSVFNAFNMSIIQSFGKNLPVYSMVFTLEQNTRRPWYGNFMFIYENYIRSSQLIRKKYKCTLELAGDTYEIIPIAFNRNRMGEEKYSLTATMTFYVVKTVVVGNPNNMYLTDPTKTTIGTSISSAVNSYTGPGASTAQTLFNSTNMGTFIDSVHSVYNSSTYKNNGESIKIVEKQNQATVAGGKK